MLIDKGILIRHRIIKIRMGREELFPTEKFKLLFTKALKRRKTMNKKNVSTPAPMIFAPGAFRMIAVITVRIDSIEVKRIRTNNIMPL
jgi:hypothetical protein